MEWTREDIEGISRRVAREVSNEVVTERFEAIGIDDSDIEHRQINIKNNFLLNSLRLRQEAAIVKNSLKDIAIQVTGQAIWVIMFSVATWLGLQIWTHMK